MNKKDYKKTFDQIKAKKSFKENTCILLNEEFENREKEEIIIMSKNKKSIFKIGAGISIGLAASLALVFSLSTLLSQDTTQIVPEQVATENSDNQPITAKAVVNIEGKIIEVSEDGKRFKLDNDLWVIITDDTEMGITGPNAAPPEEQFFEKEFRVGNSISGFTLDDTSNKEVSAYAIYNNWNWDE